jgi:hypothetical protein
MKLSRYREDLSPIAKIFTSGPRLCRALIYLLLFCLLRPLLASEPTAFDLIKEGNRYVGEQAQNKLVQIRSEKSIGGLVPAVWYVVYFDPTATFKSVEVKFGAGKMLDVKRPLRLLEPVTGGEKELPREKLKIDSNKAIKTATNEPILEKLTLKATQAKLEWWEEQPAWRIRVWAAKIQKPNEQADLGEVILSAENGKVLKSDLHIERAD